MILNMSRLRHFQTVCLGVLWRSVAFCHDPRRLITRLKWPLVSLVSLSLGYDVEQTLVSPV
jgi:hypothetical protein